MSCGSACEAPAEALAQMQRIEPAPEQVDAHVDEARDRGGRVVGVKGGENEVARALMAMSAVSLWISPTRTMSGS